MMISSSKKPPEVMSWSTPTPTPMTEEANIARQFPSAQTGVPVNRLRSYLEVNILQPTTGEELWLGLLIEQR